MMVQKIGIRGKELHCVDLELNSIINKNKKNEKWCGYYDNDDNNNTNKSSSSIFKYVMLELGLGDTVNASKGFYLI